VGGEVERVGLGGTEGVAVGVDVALKPEAVLLGEGDAWASSPPEDGLRDSETRDGAGELTDCSSVCAFTGSGVGSEVGSEAGSPTSPSSSSSPGAVVKGAILKIARLPSDFTEPLSYFFAKAVADLRGSLMFSLTLPARISTTTSDTGRPSMEEISRLMVKMAALS
jgi:hypothetical protein